MSTYPPFNTIAGAVTIGTGIGNSNGDVNFNNPDFNGDFGKCFAAAQNRGKIVVILPGEYVAKTAATITASGIEVIGVGDPNITIDSSNVTSPAVFNITSLSQVRLSGIQFTYSNWTASQKIIQAAPSSGSTMLSVEVIDCIFLAGNALATGFVGGTNEMIGIDVTNGAECLVSGCRFYPSIGLTCIKFTDGYGNKIKDNVVSNTVNVFFPDIADAQRRPMWRGVHLQDEAGFTVDSNSFRNLGTISLGGAAYQIDSAIYVDNADVPKTTEELGHGIIQDNRIEDCMTSTNCTMVLRGVRWANINGNWFCFNGVASAIGTGFLKIEGASGQTGEVSYKISVTANHFHNPGTGAAAAIYLRRCENVSIKANDFFELQTTQAIYLDNSVGTGGAMKCIAVIGNEFEWFSTSPNVRYVTLRNGSTTALENYAAMANVAYSGASAEVIDSFYNGTAPTGVYTTTKGVMDVSTGVDVATAADTTNLRTNLIMITS